jgi:V/A-type H+-transporting ATPase subunit I
MFKALPMARVTLLLLASEAQDAALLLARHGVFAPAAETDGQLPEQPGSEYREVFLEAEARLAKIMEICGELEAGPMPAEAIAPNLPELQGINGRLREIWQACSACYETEQRLQEARLRLFKLQETFDRLKELDVDLARLLRPGKLLDARIGQLPLANVHRLREALGLAHYLLTVFDQAGEQAFAVVAGPRSADGLGGLLSQAGWRELPIPAELQTHPEAARRFLGEEGRRLETTYGQHCELKAHHLARHRAWLGQARLLLDLARPLAESALVGYRGRGQLVAFSGWVPQRALEGLELALQARFQGRFILQARPPGAAEAGRIPSLLAYPAWLKPFVPLVRSYGVPRYGEFDPALLVGLTYLLLFGAMFGDVGHGAVLTLLAARLGGRLAWLRVVGMAAGLSSLSFGWIYGSVFGYEGLLQPLWQSPMHDPARMLVLAVAAGIAFIAVALLINIYNRLASGCPAAALFDSGGLAGLVFYLASAHGLFGLYAGYSTLASLLVALVALACVAVYKLAESRSPLGERLIVALVETLETATGLFANTLSFLRVAAFSLNHVALALAVFTLANSMGTAGHWLTLVLGNAIIIVLEGGIVAIQALRLIYYEGFSRFFSADGVEFVPLRLGGWRAVS